MSENLDNNPDAALLTKDALSRHFLKLTQGGAAEVIERLRGDAC